MKKQIIEILNRKNYNGQQYKPYEYADMIIREVMYPEKLKLIDEIFKNVREALFNK